MNQDLLITSSDNITLSQIDNHFGIVDSQIVVGANLFRDVFASFRDIFGGETKGYRKDIDKMKQAAVKDIKEQASKRGANAIIATRIDLDEFSGGGKSMFMLNIYGSAVRLKESAMSVVADKTASNHSEIPIEDIEFQIRRSKIEEQINASDSNMPDPSKITEYELWDDEVLRKYIMNRHSQYIEERIQGNLSEVSAEIIKSFLDDHLPEIKKDYWQSICEALEQKNWIRYDFIKEKLASENHIARYRALKLAKIDKDFYQASELHNMKELAKYVIENFKDEVPTEIVAKFMNKKEVTKCPECLNEYDVSEPKCNCGYKLLDHNSIAASLKQKSEAIKAIIEEV